MLLAEFDFDTVMPCRADDLELARQDNAALLIACGVDPNTDIRLDGITNLLAAMG